MADSLTVSIIYKEVSGLNDSTYPAMDWLRLTHWERKCQTKHLLISALLLLTPQLAESTNDCCYLYLNSIMGCSMYHCWWQTLKNMFLITVYGLLKFLLSFCWVFLFFLSRYSASLSSENKQLEQIDVKFVIIVNIWFILPRHQSTNI